MKNVFQSYNNDNNDENSIQNEDDCVDDEDDDYHLKNVEQQQIIKCFITKK